MATEMRYQSQAGDATTAAEMSAAALAVLQLGPAERVMPEWNIIKQTDETRAIELALRPHFQQADAYRQNPASVRVRVIDLRFAGHSYHEREKLVVPHLMRLPEATQLDIMVLLMLTPDEIAEDPVNAEFEDPVASSL